MALKKSWTLVGHMKLMVGHMKLMVGYLFVCRFFGLKDITKLDDLNQAIDWQNSSFYQATNQSLSVIS